MQVFPRATAGLALLVGSLCWAVSLPSVCVAAPMPNHQSVSSRETTYDSSIPYGSAFHPIPLQKQGKTSYALLASEDARIRPDTLLEPVEPTFPHVEESDVAPVPVQVLDPLPSTPAELNTSWGYGPRENKFNATILKAASIWPHQSVVLHPLLLKSLIAAESAFDPLAVSYTGAAGLAQLTPETARRFGLNWTTSRDPQYAVPAGVKVLAEKARAILDPANYYRLLGQKPENCQYAFQVAQAYEQYGTPNADQAWHLILGAYNGGGGTILRAMAIAYQRGLDPREWSNLVGNKAAPQNTPLYLACRDIFGRGAGNKYKELSHYPLKIMKNYHQTSGTTPLANAK